MSVVVTMPPRAHAYFERFVLSARAFSLGGAFVCVADDPSATVINPAGLTQVWAPSLLTSVARPYGLDELEEHYVAFAMPTKFASFGVSWHRFGLEGVTEEDLISIGVGRDLIRTSQDASLSVGGAIDIARVAVQDRFGASDTKVTGTLSVLLRPFPVIGFGYTVRNIVQPTFDLIPGGGVTRLETTHAIGFAYYWRESAVVLYETDRDQDGRWLQRLGVEINAMERLALRTGLANGDITGGLGLSVSGLAIDVGVTSHSALGLSYLFSLGFDFPGGRREGF